MCIFFVDCFVSFAQYVDNYVYKYVEMLRYRCMYYCIKIIVQTFAQIAQIENPNICSTFGNLGKYRLFVSRGYQKPEHMFCFSGSL